MEYIIEKTKTNSGTRKLPMTKGVYQCFLNIIEDRGFDIEGCGNSEPRGDNHSVKDHPVKGHPVKDHPVKGHANRNCDSSRINSHTNEGYDPSQFEKRVCGYTGFLYLDKNGMPEVAMHWQHRFKNVLKRYNEIYREQMPSVTPHVCRHTYCSNQAKAGMNPKTLQYLMGHSNIEVTMNVYTHLGLEDAAAEMQRLEQMEEARREQERFSREEEEEN